MNSHAPRPVGVPLRRLAIFNPSAPELSADEEVSFVPMASVSELGTMRVAEHISASDLKTGYSYMQSGDVLVAKITPCFENNKIAIATLDRFHGFGSTEFHVIRADASALDNRYLVHFLRQDRIRYAGERRMTGSAGQQRVPRQFLEELSIPLPPLDEQRRIRAILDQADDLRRKRREALAILERLVLGLLQNLQQRLPANVFRHTNLGEIATVATGSTPDRGATGFYGGQIPWVKTTEVARGGTITETEERVTPAGVTDARLKLFPKNSLVIAMYGQGTTRGKVAKLGIDATVNQACAVIVPNDIFEPDFLFYRLAASYDELRSLGRGGNQPNLNLDLVRGIEILLPPLDVQRAFAARVAEIDKLKAHHRTHLAELDALFASLQHRAFRGEL